MEKTHKSKAVKIGVIADTHIPDRAQTIPQVILESFKGVDVVIHAGDLVELGVLDKLKGACAVVKAVWGNMDSPEVKRALPEKEILKIGHYNIGITHGYGHPSKLIELVTEIFKGDNVNLIIFGHAHFPINEKRNNVLYFNPGSSTDAIFAPFNSYGIVEIDAKIEARIIRI